MGVEKGIYPVGDSSGISYQLLGFGYLMGADMMWFARREAHPAAELVGHVQ